MPGWLGFVTTAPTTAAVAASVAAVTAGAQRYLHQSFNHLEHLGLRWLAELCGLPAAATGVFASGGSTANLVALGTARQAAFERRGVDVAEDGLPTDVRGRIYTSERAHRTVHRSAAVLGLGRQGVRSVATSSGGPPPGRRSRPGAGRRPGGRDPADRRRGRRRVDRHGIGRCVGPHRRRLRGARGLAPRRRRLRVGGSVLPGRGRPLRRRRTSRLVDRRPHKWLAAPVGVGAAYVRDGDSSPAPSPRATPTTSRARSAPPSLRRCRSSTASAAGWADQSVELSSPSRGATVWAVLREIGREGVGGAGPARHRPGQRRGRPRPGPPRARAAVRAGAVDRLLPLRPVWRVGWACGRTR